MPLTFDRGHTSLERLDLDWDYPVYTPEEAKDGNTRAVVRAALPLESVFQEVAGDDRRPLLVLRECLNCKGSDLALLSTRFENERTVLLASWFHCVKLPPHVVDTDHPFHNLFANSKGAHLFVSSWNGEGRIDLDGTQSQGKLWKAMNDVLRRDYEGNPDDAVKELLKLLNQFDRIDAQEADLMLDLDKELERKGADSPRIPRIQAKLKELGLDKKRLLEREKELRTMGLKAPEPAPEQPVEPGK